MICIDVCCNLANVFVCGVRLADYQVDLLAQVGGQAPHKTLLLPRAIRHACICTWESGSLTTGAGTATMH